MLWEPFEVPWQLEQRSHFDRISCPILSQTVSPTRNCPICLVPLLQLMTFYCRVLVCLLWDCALYGGWLWEGFSPVVSHGNIAHLSRSSLLYLIILSVEENNLLRSLHSFVFSGLARCWKHGVCIFFIFLSFYNNCLRYLCLFMALCFAYICKKF